MKKNVKIKIYLSQKNNWKKIKLRNSEIFYKGFFFGKNTNKLKFFFFQHLRNNINLNFLNQNFGNFSIVIRNKKTIYLISDNARSFPLYYYFKDDTIIISDFIRNFKKDLSNLQIDNEMKILSLMSGFTISNYTLYKNIYTVNAGEYVKINQKIKSKFYVKYFPDQLKPKSFDEYKKNYINTLDSIFVDIKNKIRGKKLYLALSAGDDSRLIACMLKRHNFKNVTCFSYGLKNNWESKVAKKISDKLGFKFIEIVIERNGVSKFFRSNEFKKYFRKFNNFDATPSIHEIYAIKYLKRIIGKNSFIINGQPADGINGSYIYKEFLSKKNYLKIVFDKIIDKHYSLWEGLKSKTNLQIIKKYLKKEYSRYSKKKIKYPYQLMLFTSYQNRISKYLMKNFQVYENYKFRWFSPYMDLRFVKFWFSIPPDYHFKRNLSKQILKDLNLYNMWDREYKKNNYLSIKTNIFRNFLKILFLFNKNKWKKFDKLNFQYFNDNQLKTHIIKQKEWKKNPQFRNAISFLVLKWLKITNVKKYL